MLEVKEEGEDNPDKDAAKMRSDNERERVTCRQCMGRHL